MVMWSCDVISVIVQESIAPFSIYLQWSRGGELGEPGELDGSPLFWEIIYNFQISKMIVCNNDGSKVIMYLLFGKKNPKNGSEILYL